MTNFKKYVHREIHLMKIGRTYYCSSKSDTSAIYGPFGKTSTKVRILDFFQIWGVQIYQISYLKKNILDTELWLGVD